MMKAMYVKKLNHDKERAWDQIVTAWWSHQKVTGNPNHNHWAEISEELRKSHPEKYGKITNKALADRAQHKSRDLELIVSIFEVLGCRLFIVGPGSEEPEKDMKTLMQNNIDFLEMYAQLKSTDKGLVRALVMRLLEKQEAPGA